MSDFINAPWTLIKVTENHDAYIVDANGTTVCERPRHRDDQRVIRRWVSCTLPLLMLRIN